MILPKGRWCAELGERGDKERLYQYSDPSWRQVWGKVEISPSTVKSQRIQNKPKKHSTHCCEKWRWLRMHWWRGCSGTDHVFIRQWSVTDRRWSGDCARTDQVADQELNTWPCMQWSRGWSLTDHVFIIRMQIRQKTDTWRFGWRVKLYDGTCTTIIRILNTGNSCLFFSFYIHVKISILNKKDF